MLACCGSSDARADELACQQRLVSASSGSGPASEAFDRVSRTYREMDLGGCSDEQRQTAAAMARAAADISAVWRRIGDVMGRSETDPELRSNADFLMLQDRIEGWERRRERLRRDLEALSAER